MDAKIKEILAAVCNRAATLEKIYFIFLGSDPKPVQNLWQDLGDIVKNVMSQFPKAQGDVLFCQTNSPKPQNIWCFNHKRQRKAAVPHVGEDGK